MKHLKVFLPLILFCTWALSPNAYALQSYGVGAVSCETYTTLFNKKDLSDAEKSEWNALLNWILGYLTGMNMSASIDGEGRDISVEDANSLLSAIDDNCKKNPTFVLPDIAAATFIELQIAQDKF